MAYWRIFNNFLVLKLNSIVKLITAQIVAVCLLFISFWYLKSFESALSVLLGGMVCIIPTLIFALLFFKHSGASAARKIVNNFYVGEALKIVFTVFLFILVFQWQKVHAGALFTGFIIAQLIYWLFI